MSRESVHRWRRRGLTLERADELALIDAGLAAAPLGIPVEFFKFYVFRDGLILRQSTYDCYEPVAGRRPPRCPTRMTPH